MHNSWLPIVLTFVLAGVVKGITGMGLPTVSMGVLGLLMAPADAASLLLIPSLVTNVWQFAAGPNRATTLRRTWPMLLMICLATVASAGLLTAFTGATAALGIALIAYAAISLAKVHLAIPHRAEPWLSPLIGATTGVVTGATGVFVIPAVPYLQAIGLQRDDLVQALGLSFTVSTIALAIGLAAHGALHITAGATSLLCTIPALLGMFLGQAVRTRVDPATFRLCFFIALLLLGADLAARAVT
jgi:uncharacterized membrane protein YfcA